jgi:small ligand-binding sensory domain FIST
MAIRASVGAGVSSSWEEALEFALNEAIEPDGIPNLAFVYLSDRFTAYAEHIREAVLERTGVDTLSGTVGIGLCATGQEYMDEPAIVILLMELPEGAFHGRSIDAEGEMVPINGSHDHPMAIVHIDPRNRAVNEGFEDLFPETFLMGGLTSSRVPGVQLTSEHTMIGGISAIMLDSNIQIHSLVAQGCSLLGNPHRVTQATGHYIFTLDDRPALEVFREEMELAATELGEIDLSDIFVGFSVPNRDKPEYMIRNLVGFNEDQGILAVAHECTTGQTLQFSLRNRESAVEDMRIRLEALRERLNGPPKAALYFSCVARGINLFNEPNFELKLIQEILGDFPLAGFFGNGEINHHQLYGHTGILTVFA